jgi:HSP90 family molecular chaperone
VLGSTARWLLRCLRALGQLRWSSPIVPLQDYAGVMAWSHFKAEGDVEFRSILYIPGFAQYNFYDKYYENQVRGLKLYVRRVFISDYFTELIPRWA